MQLCSCNNKLSTTRHRTECERYVCIRWDLGSRREVWIVDETSTKCSAMLFLCQISDTHAPEAANMQICEVLTRPSILPSLPLSGHWFRADAQGLFLVGGDTQQLPAFRHSSCPPSTAIRNIIGNHRVVALDTEYRQHLSLGAMASHFF